MTDNLERRCRKPGCGALERIGNPCYDWDCPQIHVAASNYRRLQEALAAAEAEVERLLPIEAEAAGVREINGELRAKLVEAELRLTALRWAGAGLANIAHNIHQLGAADPNALQSLKSGQLEWDAAIRSLSNEEAPK